MTTPPDPLAPTPESGQVGATATLQGPQELLTALRASAGSLVDGADVGSWDHAPDVSGLPTERAGAVLAAWTGARLHAGAPGLLEVSDADARLLVGDWCFAHALQALARSGDLAAIGMLATAIGACATALSDGSERPELGLERLETIWGHTIQELHDRLAAR